MAKSAQRRASNRKHDAKRRAEQPWRAWYKDPRWVKGRVIHLQRHPLCIMCLARGVTRAATVVDHFIPHRGDARLFFDPTNWQSLCGPDHDIHKQRLEQRGYSDALDADGWPIDPMHPANAGAATGPKQGLTTTPGGVKSLGPGEPGPAGIPAHAISRNSEGGGSIHSCLPTTDPFDDVVLDCSDPELIAWHQREHLIKAHGNR